MPLALPALFVERLSSLASGSVALSVGDSAIVPASPASPVSASAAQIRFLRAFGPRRDESMLPTAAPLCTAASSQIYCCRSCEAGPRRAALPLLLDWGCSSVLHAASDERSILTTYTRGQRLRNVPDLSKRKREWRLSVSFALAVSSLHALPSDIRVVLGLQQATKGRTDCVS